jgi:hypothetical protein
MHSSYYVGPMGNPDPTIVIIAKTKCIGTDLALLIV